MESFELIKHPETIRLLDYPELIKPNVKIDDIRKVIKDKIGIKEKLRGQKDIPLYILRLHQA